VLPRLRSVDPLVATLASGSLIAGAVIIGLARAAADRFLYISELGAIGMPTAARFQVGFVLVAVGILLVAVVLRDVRSRLPLLRRVTPAAALVAAGALFLVAAAVPCSMGCPSLLTDAAQWRDWVHIVAAVLAFVAGCVAMLQFATAHERWVARLSTVSGLAVGVIAATGGIISLARGNTDIGSTLEYIAAAIGLVWLMVMAVVHCLPHRPRALPGRSALDGASLADAAAPSLDRRGAGPTG